VEAERGDDKDAVWIGACVFKNSNNPYAKPTADKNHKGKPDDFSKGPLIWFNNEMSPKGTHDWDYSYDPPTNKLSVYETRGVWFDKKDDPKANRNGKVYETQKIVDQDKYDAPKEFKDIKFKGKQLTYVPGSGFAAEALALSLDSVSDGVWTYTLIVNALGGAGTLSDPFLGREVLILAGDSFTIAAPCISAPFVSESASRYEYGGWVVLGYTTESVTFRATYSADFGPGALIEAFGFSSSNLLAQSVPWDFASSNPTVGSASRVLGPSPCYGDLK
jgi:hypothetical protein